MKLLRSHDNNLTSDHEAAMQELPASFPEEQEGGSVEDAPSPQLPQCPPVLYHGSDLVPGDIVVVFTGNSDGWEYPYSVAQIGE